MLKSSSRKTSIINITENPLKQKGEKRETEKEQLWV